MKKKIGAIALAVLLACTLFAVTGCKKDDSAAKINIDNYSIGLNDPLYNTFEMINGAKSKPYTTAAEFTGGTPVDINTSGMAIVATPDDTYKLLNVETGAYALNGAAFDNMQFIATPGSHSVSGFVKTTTGTGSEATIAVYDPNGNAILAAGKYVGNSIALTETEMYVDGKLTTSTIVKLAYKTTDANAQTQYKYFEQKIDYTNFTVSYAATEESKLSLSPVSTNIGDVLTSTQRHPIVDADGAEILGDMQYAEYSASSYYGTSGVTYTIYKSGEKTGEFTMQNGDILTVLDRYILYCETRKVPYDAQEGYNVYNPESKEKSCVSYYRYDFVKNKVSRLDTDFYITNNTAYPLLNLKKNVQDFAQIEAIPFENGVATLSNSTRTYVVDSKLRVSLDLSAKPFSLEMPIRLREGKNARYLIGNCITDKKLNVIADLGSRAQIYKDLELLTFYKNGLYGAVDFDGKIVMQPKYENLSFAGNTACTKIDGKEDEDDVYYLVSPTAPNGKKVSEVDEHITHPEASLLYGFLFAQNETTAKVYNVTGTNILTLENVDDMIVKTLGTFYILEFEMTDGNYKTYILQ